MRTVLRTADGIELFLRTWPVPDGTARAGSLLLVHGLGEHCHRYEHVAEAIAALGLEVHAYDHRGHGRSGGARGVIPPGEALVDDLRVVVRHVAADGGEPPFLLGHSMGGTVAARAATAGVVTPRGLILSSPGLRIPLSRAQRVQLAIGRRLAPDRAVASGLPAEAVSRDAAVVAAYRADEHVHDRISPRLLDFMQQAGSASIRDAHRVTVATLLLVAGADRLVDPAASRAFFDGLPPGAGTLRVYDDLFHEVFNEREPDRTRVLSDLADWLRAQLAPVAV
jgi:alpha-beta hydrolase superfamily lysophospholipase